MFNLITMAVLCLTVSAQPYMYNKVYTARETDPEDKHTLHFFRNGSYYQDKYGIQYFKNERFDSQKRMWTGAMRMAKGNYDGDDQNIYGYNVTLYFE